MSLCNTPHDTTRVIAARLDPSDPTGCLVPPTRSGLVIQHVEGIPQYFQDYHALQRERFGLATAQVWAPEDNGQWCQPVHHVP